MRNHATAIVLGIFGALLVFSSGCGTPDANSVNAPVIPPLPAGVTLHHDKDIQGVWLAPGFSFKDFDSLYVGPTAFNALSRPNEVEMRGFAIYSVRAQEAAALRDSGLFSTVAINTNDIPPGHRTLTLENTIIEYEKGGGGARYWAGTFGAGQPVIKVRGLMYDGARLVFVYEARRSGDSGNARMFGGFLSDKDIQRDDIRDLAADLAAFMVRTTAP